MPERRLGGACLRIISVTEQVLETASTAGFDVHALSLRDADVLLKLHRSLVRKVHAAASPAEPCDGDLRAAYDGGKTAAFRPLFDLHARCCKMSAVEQVHGLRHHFAPYLTHFPALHRPSRAVRRALPGGRACGMLIGACDPML